MPHAHLSPRWPRILALTAALTAVLLALQAGAARAACGNPVACENQLPGAAPSSWQVTGIGDSTIQGYATQFSVNVGQTEYFKIDTPSSNYHIDILRLGYYGGDGARVVAADIRPSVSLPQSQPACLTDSATGLIDCGNWSVSASWTVPSTAVSGVYIAHLVRDDAQDPGGDSQIPFVVRNDASHADIVLATSDATWEAYNDYGGNSLYTCTVACPPGNPLAYKAAYAVSYNRPFDGAFTTDGGASYLWYSEYELIYWLEENGYDVSYVSDADLDRDPALLENHRLFISSGHDEYWSEGEYQGIRTALADGVNLAFFSGNEMFWKTRWANSEDGSSTPYRTLVSYKETHFNGPTDPEDPPTWTGAWADPRFSPPADGGVPANSLTGQEFLVNSGSGDITVPSQYSKLRFWRDTRVASLSPGQTLTLAPGCDTLGYEWDVDADNGFRPPGEIDMSSTTLSGVQPFTDYGSTTGTGTVTHHLTLYRAPSGALVFGAGTVQWAWGLDEEDAWNSAGPPGACNPDPNMEQATVNLFADMGVQPTTLMPGLVAVSQSGDTTPPSSTITAPSPGSSFANGSRVTISGTASDSGGGVVAGVEVSTDGGSSWHPAQLTTADGTTVSWTYNWVAQGNSATTIRSRATDDSGNVETPAAGVSVNVSCPCSLWGGATPQADPGEALDSEDPNPINVGMKFTSDRYGTVTAIRFYKDADEGGTHVGSLWTAGGQLLASVTFSNETASGWQQANLATPVTIMPDTTYVVSYFAPDGDYPATTDYFYPAPSPSPVGGANFDNPPLHAVPMNTSPNGLYSYASASAFPTSSYFGTNYWVDVSFSPAPPPGQVTNVTASPGTGTAQVSWTAPSSGGPVTTYTVTPYVGGVAQTPTTVVGSPPLTTATVANLTAGTSYTFTVTASNPNGAGAPSAPSNAVTPAAPTAPSAPGGVSAAPASSQALVSWSPPSSTGGSSLTGYTVTPYIGSAAQPPTQVSDPSATSATVTGLTDGVTYTFTVSATNAVGSSGPSAASNPVTPEDTIFDFTTPPTVDSGDANAVNLGVRFQSSQAGWVTGVRFYKAPANTGTHIGSLWTADGTLLASATFSGESASGWQDVTFPAPVQIAANTPYVASYYAPSGHYSVAADGFASAVSNPPLQALATGSAPDGLYAYGANGFPSSTYNGDNYYVDPMFQPMPTPGQVTNVIATAGRAGAHLSWSAPSTGGPVASYTITPYLAGAAQPPTTVSGSPPPTTASVGSLTPGASYTFTVTAANANGAGPASAASNAVTPLPPTAPAAPTGVSATPASGEALVSWSPPTSDGGSPLTGYTVTPYIGSSAQTPVQVLDPAASSATVTGLTDGTAYTFTVSATNDVGTSAPSADSPPVTPAQTIFNLDTPANIDSGDGHSVSLGTEFTSSQPGWITGVRFYKAPANTGTHTGSLWTADGTRLATATFTGETASGWQAVTFAQPVEIAAGTPYIVSYYAPNGHYSADPNGFAAAINAPPLQAPANSTAANGLYAYYGDLFPNSSYDATNYYVDPMFQPAGPPPSPSGVTASPAGGAAQVSWSPPTSDGGSPLTGYTVTPYIGSSAQTPVRVSGGSATSATVTGLSDGTAYTFTVAATNSAGTGTASAPSAPVTPQDTIFDFQKPLTIDSGDASGITLGVKFTPSVSGHVLGIRFYKAPANTGVHVGSLWDASGNLLATTTFTNETASGWQFALFAQPVAVTAGSTYVAAYFAPNGHYSASANGLASAVSNPPLEALASSASANGIYTYGSSSAFPSSSYNATNYWVDVLFSAS